MGRVCRGVERRVGEWPWKHRAIPFSPPSCPCCLLSEKEIHSFLFSPNDSIAVVRSYLDSHMSLHKHTMAPLVSLLHDSLSDLKTTTAMGHFGIVTEAIPAPGDSNSKGGCTVKTKAKASLPSPQLPGPLPRAKQCLLSPSRIFQSI